MLSSFFLAIIWLGEVIMSKEKKAKTKRIKEQNFHTEEGQEMMRFIKILLIVIVLVVGVYLFTRIFITKDLLNKEEEQTNEPVAGTVDYTKTLIGNMFTKPEKEYYVFIFNSEDMNSIYYSGLITAYKSNTDSLKIYVADLNNELNKKYIDTEKENIKTNDLGGFKVSSPTLLKIKNKEIVSTFTTDEEFASELTSQTSSE